jgi:hypothetical protein
MKAISKLVAVFAFSYISSKSGKKTYAYVLDGTEEQHDNYLNHVDLKFQPEGGFDDRDGKLPELKGNPVFYSSTFKGAIVEIHVPEEADKQPRIQSDELDQELDMCDITGEDKRAVLNAHMKSLQKYRASVKPTADSDSDVDSMA